MQPPTTRALRPRDEASVRASCTEGSASHPFAGVTPAAPSGGPDAILRPTVTGRGHSPAGTRPPSARGHHGPGTPSDTSASLTRLRNASEEKISDRDRTVSLSAEEASGW